MSISKEQTAQLYRLVYLMRQAEEKVREIYPTDVMKTPVHLSLGEEAVMAGVVSALEPSDLVFGTYRSHALYLAKGGDLDQFFGELYGVQCGVARGKAGSMHLSAPEVGFMASSAVVASIIPVAMARPLPHGTVRAIRSPLFFSATAPPKKASSGKPSISPR